MVVTTTDIKNEYEVKGIVRYYLAGSFAKSTIGQELTLNESIDYIIDNFLMNQAKNKNADAIVGLRIEIFSGAGMMAVGSNLLLYGTAVKLK